MNYLTRITINPEICHGKPIVRGMRWPVVVLLDLLASGMTNEEILKEHPELEREDILAVLQYAGLLASGRPLSEVLANPQ
ncbi:DUF433 domain-containing protein [Hymenobacter psoromatis]|uniref:DUF433 domain-containing protein n=1 Tax=Hymenobacter psoromatis TaxID=1484116 RepID=UPI001CBF00B3|nr:DUF433 domain-containing protein [Hymenobacter psoromatis]